MPCREEWLPTPVFLPGEFYGQKSLAGYSPWGCEESDTTERLALPLHSEIGPQHLPHLFFFHSNLRNWTQESESCEGKTLLEEHLKFKPLEKIGSWLCDTSGESKYFKAQNSLRSLIRLIFLGDLPLGWNDTGEEALGGGWDDYVNWCHGWFFECTGSNWNFLLLSKRKSSKNQIIQ